MNIFNYEQFKKNSNEFKLGNLTTESIHNKSISLASDSINNLEKAVETLKIIDSDALNILKTKYHEIENLYDKCTEVKKTNGRIFLCGCGATGRLALTIEVLARINKDFNVVGFMAGGDYALIKSVESFEDNKEYGSKQLKELGFNENDLLLAITEGGETSFVIGAAEEAAKISSHNPFFIYCNPDNELMRIHRSKKILNNPKINKLNLTVGAMALSGSTRMQATTVQMLSVGLAILSTEGECFKTNFDNIIDQLQQLNYHIIQNFIKLESEIYNNGGYITYLSDESLAISILTDTTERSPTFSLASFEMENKHHSLCFLTIEKTNGASNAWKTLLKRDPRALRWKELNGVVDLQKIYNFDISQNSIQRRNALGCNKVFSILKKDNVIEFSLSGHIKTIDISHMSDLCQHLAIKLLLNTMSTLIMGRIGRYQSNLMTWVRPSNFKLIDRATRYAKVLLEQENILKSYDEISKAVIDISKDLSDNEPIVLKVVEHFKTI